jgi:prepilin-type N-terminal cleavage/methylation domain-containing protein
MNWNNNAWKAGFSLKRTTRMSALGEKAAAGFSLVELAVAVAIILIVSAVAIPTITRVVKNYQLNDAATRLASILKFTRFEAIRRNSPISCVNSQAVVGGPANVWSDDNGDTVEQATETQILLSQNATLIAAASVPNTAGLATAVRVTTLTTVSPTNGSIRFDQRGAVVPAAVYVEYVADTSSSGGYRAVVVLPSGSIQVWNYAGGATPWQKVN